MFRNPVIVSKGAEKGLKFDSLGNVDFESIFDEAKKFKKSSGGAFDRFFAPIKPRNKTPNELLLDVLDLIDSIKNKKPCKTLGVKTTATKEMIKRIRRSFFK